MSEGPWIHVRRSDVERLRARNAELEARLAAQAAELETTEASACAQIGELSYRCEVFQKERNAALDSFEKIHDRLAAQEASLPECVQRWRSATQFHGVDKDYGRPKGHRIQLDCGECICEDGGRNQDSPAGDAIRCLDWLATAPPAIILAASGDVEVLRDLQEGCADFDDEDTCQAYGRARILDGAEWVVLRRDGLDELIAAIVDSWDRGAGQGELRALIEASGS